MKQGFFIDYMIFMYCKKAVLSYESVFCTSKLKNKVFYVAVANENMLILRLNRKLVLR